MTFSYHDNVHHHDMLLYYPDMVNFNYHLALIGSYIIMWLLNYCVFPVENQIGL